MKRNTIRVQKAVSALWEADLMDLRRTGWPCADEYAPEAREIAARRGTKTLRKILVEVWSEWMGGCELTPRQIRSALTSLQTPKPLTLGIRNSHSRPAPKSMAKGRRLSRRRLVLWV